MTRLLRAELATRHIALCETPDAGAPPPIAIVSMSLAADTATVRVEVHDRVTAKIVSRDVSLAGVPDDTRALTVALAGDELLRASWAELALQSSPTPKEPPPAEVLAVVRAELPVAHAKPPRAALGLAGAMDVFVGSATSTLLGADLVGEVWIVPRVRVEARFGVRSGLKQSGPDGDVATSTLGGKLGGSVSVTTPDRPLGLDVTARLGVMRASFVPTAYTSATATPASDVAVTVEATADGWLKLGTALRLVATVGPAIVLRPVRVTDGATVIGGIDGAGVTAALGLWGAF